MASISSCSRQQQRSPANRTWAPQLFIAALLAALLGLASADGSLDGFPWCRCARASFDTPYRITSVQESETATTRDYTFQFRTSGCYIQSPCCGMDLNKVAFHAKSSCNASSLAKVAVNTILVDYSVVSSERVGQFRSYGANKLMFKVANLRWIFEDVDASSLTLSLRKGTPCDTLDTFLEESYFSLIDKATKCCPTLPLPPITASA